MDAEGEPHPTLLERAHRSGYRTGLVTDSYIWDATPAAFSTHSDRRDAATEIMTQLAASSLEVLFGELEDVGEGEVPDRETTVALLERRFHLLASGRGGGGDLRAGPAPPAPVAGLWEEEWITDLDSTPNLPTLVEVALERLAWDRMPFVLLVESEEPDSASHRNDLERLLAGMAVIEAAVTQVLDFAERDGETLVVFTSDHETGGLALSVTDATNATLRALWSSYDHTGVAVPLMAFGPASELFAGIHTSRGVGRALGELVEPASIAESPAR